MSDDSLIEDVREVAALLGRTEAPADETVAASFERAALTLDEDVRELLARESPTPGSANGHAARSYDTSARRSRAHRASRP